MAEGAQLGSPGRGRLARFIAQLELLGVTQGAVSQMLNSERDIRVRKSDDGYQAVEIRPVGSRRKPRAA